ncbi:MAG: hypothetical protein ACYDIE_05845 [Candidatus Krumholzibacteriia bacterium]
MQRLVNTVSLVAALITLAVSMWRESGPWAALKRAGIAYLAFFTVFALLALVFRAGVLAENRPAAPPGAPPPGGGKEPPPAR